MKRCSVCEGELTLTRANSRYNVWLCLNPCRIRNQPQGCVPVSGESHLPDPLGLFVRAYRSVQSSQEPPARQDQATKVNHERKRNNYRKLRANNFSPEVATKNSSDKRTKALLEQCGPKGVK